MLQYLQIEQDMTLCIKGYFILTHRIKSSSALNEDL